MADMISGEESFVLSKKYTDNSIKGITGALVGKNCTIKSIVKRDGRNTITFEWTANDGTTRESVMIVLDGTPIYVWTSGDHYEYGDLVIYASCFYRCITPNDDIEFDDTKWNEIGSPDGNYDIVQNESLLPTIFTAADRKMYYSIEDSAFWLWNGEEWLLQRDTAIDDIFAIIAHGYEFKESRNYSIGDITLYENKLYEFTTEHPAGPWIGTDVNIAFALINFIQAHTDRIFKINQSIATKIFNPSQSFVAGELVWNPYSLKLIRFTKDYNGDISTFSNSYIEENIANVIQDIIKNFTDIFDESDSYSAGDIVVHNLKLYQFTTNHSAGVWNESEVIESSLLDLIKLLGIGKSLAGKTVKPTSDTEVTAGDGAEIFNDYRDRTFSGTAVTAGNVASGDYSHAEGQATTANGDYSHAEGLYSIAGGRASHAEGSAKVSGDQAHGEGNGCISTGLASHTEGQVTFASGNSAHAEGFATQAVGNYSHAEGNFTIAGYRSQHVLGEYNNNKSDTRLEIGAGTSSNRSNVFEIYNDGSQSQDDGASKFRFTRVNGEDGYYDSNYTFHAFNSPSNPTLDINPSASTIAEYPDGTLWLVTS